MNIIDDTGTNLTVAFSSLAIGDAFDDAGTFYIVKNASTGVRLDDLSDIPFAATVQVKKRTATVHIAL